MSTLPERLERWQLPLCLAAVLAGFAVGWAVPAVSAPLELILTPVLALLMCATFLAVPLGQLGASLRDVRFVGAILVLNFLVVPGVVWMLTRTDAGLLLAAGPVDAGVRIGVALVLLAPCVDYVIAFTGIAGGARERLLAAAPLLLLVQGILLPVYLPLMVGGTELTVEPGPFVEALVFLIVIPLIVAALTQATHSRSGIARGISRAGAAWMVPLMMATLFTVVAAQSAQIGSAIGTVLTAVPTYIVFVVLMLPLGLLVGRVFRLDIAGARALTMSGATRNSLVVLPLALALPEPLHGAALVIVTQTLVELTAMPAVVRAVPRIIR
ncbi:arsenic resistance protein [Mycetocola tolaasinivorans]|uniref:Arsenic resistance protein n=1 Tax=Mycetocola tolaasinivorans TaxID=76635 RepID=A0A3L7AAP9_9MICO|nr:bile acid:sodium symporter [Mycetocola tolaasinivorans]RLP77546.1 arsenic resistance protein [Mycetocola tolaasinivorans]